jgi:predicted peroxiredoxin
VRNFPSSQSIWVFNGWAVGLKYNVSNNTSNLERITQRFGSEQPKSTEQQEIHIVLVSNDPQRVYPALTLALGGASMGAKAYIYCTMGGLEAIKRETAGKIQLPGLPSVEKYVKDALDSGVSICACAPSKEMLSQMGVSQSSVFEGVRIEDVTGFLSAALPAAKNGGVVLFV